MSKEHLAFALDAGGGIGAWGWDIRNDRVYSDPRFAEVFSVDPSRAATGAPIGDFLNAIHPADRDRIREDIQRSIDKGGDYAAEFRIAQADGSVRWVYARGRCHLDQNGVPSRFPGVVSITERKHVEVLIREGSLLCPRFRCWRGAGATGRFPQALQRCTEAIVNHLDAAFARIWTLDASQSVLELQASAGIYTHPDGPHSRIPVGSFKIGLIAQERQPHLT